MAGEYRTVPIGELASSISETHRLGKEQLIFLNTSDILHGKFLHRNYTAVTNWPGQAKKSIRMNDILFSEIRPANGRWAFVEENADDFVVSTKLMVIRAKQDRLFPKFLYQFLTSEDITKWLQHLAESRSGTFPQITFAEIATIEIPLPPLAEQRAIAAVLGALDDKIELNRRMNGTLESMARALFQSWFVDFDPVRAKLDGRQPTGLDPETAALFPDSFEDSELGAIPRGWKVCPLSEKIELLSGGTPKTSEPLYWDGDMPWYSVKDAPSATDVWVIQTEKQVTTEGIANSATQVLPEGVTIISARGTVGKLALIGTPMAMNQSCYGVRGIAGYGEYFTYFALRQATAELQQRTHGTVFDTITRQTFDTLDCIFPPANLTREFDRTVAPLLAQIRANLQQSRTLATLRDALLPKLLSGELSVAGAESLMEHA
jgi:type I restriction enzyme S subunit